MTNIINKDNLSANKAIVLENYTIESRIASCVEFIFEQICEIFESLKNLVYSRIKITPEKEAPKAKAIAKKAFYQTLISEGLTKFLPKDHVVFGYLNPMNGKFVGNLSVENTLEDGSSYRVHLTLPDSASDEEIERLKLHPLMTRQLETLVGPGDLSHLLLAIPTQASTIRWNGKDKEATVVLNFPCGGKLEFFVKLAQKESEDIPEFLTDFLSDHLREALPMIQPLFSQNFAFIWDGQTSQFKLLFESQQTITIKDLVLKGKGFIKQIAEKLVKNTHIKLPREITGKIDFEKLSIKFGDKTSFNVENVSKFDLDEVSFNPKEKEVEFQVMLWGFIPFRHKIDLKQSRVDKVAIEINARENAKQELKKETVRSKKNKEESLHSLLMKQAMSAIPNINANVSASQKLEDGTNCTVKLVLPHLASKKEVEGLKLHPFFAGKLETMTSADLSKWLLTLPTQASTIDWNFAQKEAKVIIDLPEGGKIEVTVQFPSDKAPKFIEDILSHQLKELFPVVKPLLSESFTFIWDGSKKQFKLFFIHQQKIRIKDLVLKDKGFLQTIGQQIGKNTEINLPKQISGTVDFENLSVNFGNTAKFTIPVGIFDKDIDLKEVRFNPEKQELDVKAEFFGTQSIKVDLKKESSLDKIDIEFSRVPNKR